MAKNTTRIDAGWLSDTSGNGENTPDTLETAAKKLGVLIATNRRIDWLQTQLKRQQIELSQLRPPAQEEVYSRLSTLEWLFAELVNRQTSPSIDIPLRPESV